MAKSKIYNPSIYISRAGFEKTKAKIGGLMYTVIGELGIEAYVTKEPVSFNDKTSGKYLKLSKGDSWGKLFDCGWFHFSGKIPDKAKGKKTLFLIDISGEGLVYDNDGNTVRGITNKSSGYDYTHGYPGKSEVYFSDSAKGGEAVDFWMDAGCNDLFGNLKDNAKIMNAEIAIENALYKKLYFDYEFMLSFFDGLVLDKNMDYAKEVYNALKSADKIINKGLDDKGAAEIINIFAKFINNGNKDERLLLTSLGHAHLDLAWLWPIRETLRKGARTFSTTLQLLDEYPEYQFGASQAQLFKWMKDNYPALYARIKEKVKEGRIEVQGAMWVEPDSNLLSLESLVRQIMYGKKFFMEEFGLDMEMMWVPDSFGYSGALPQVLKKSGIKYFMTQKMSWNTVNKFPYHTFIWKGIDGSEVLTHMLPSNTYNGSHSPRDVMFTKNNFAEKAISDDVLYLYGIGDGGGGPGLEHIERLKRCESTANLPTAKSGFAIDFFKKIEKDYDKYPVYSGELYLEKHQGTYTTQAKNKKYNRKVELLLREAEYALSLSSIYAKTEYDPNVLIDLWHEVLLYHFHDILPGSSIKRVYDESVERYIKIAEKLKEIIKDSYKKVAECVANKGGNALVFNSLSFNRNEYIKYKNDYYWLNIPATSYSLLDEANLVKTFKPITAKTTLLENELIKITFDKRGNIIGIYDKENDIEYIESGKKANEFQLYKDLGDGWDIRPARYYKFGYKKAKLQSAAATIDGPKASVLNVFQIGNSKITQKISIFDNSKDIIFETDVDFKETYKMLRVNFPLNIYADKVKYNIQGGYIERNTAHKNSFDKAKYEVSGQKFVDVNDGAKGITLSNDCKYGYKNWDNEINLNLLRSPMRPGVDADKGMHSFKYVLTPYKGAYENSECFKKGYVYNVPLRLIDDVKSKEDTFKGLVSVKNDQIILETVKKSQDGKGYIFRFYNSTAEKAETHLSLADNLKAISFTDLMENATEKIDINKEISFKPFEIMTIYAKVND